MEKIGEDKNNNSSLNKNYLILMAENLKEIKKSQGIKRVF
jgi:hypothetical protein